MTPVWHMAPGGTTYGPYVSTSLKWKTRTPRVSNLSSFFSMKGMFRYLQCCQLKKSTSPSFADLPSPDFTFFWPPFLYYYLFFFLLNFEKSLLLTGVTPLVLISTYRPSTPLVSTSITLLVWFLDFKVNRFARTTRCRSVQNPDNLYIY